MAQVSLADTKGDQWDEMAKIYRSLTVETSRAPIRTMLEKANALLPFSEATAILDNGCGPGPVMSKILDEYAVPESCALLCADFSGGMINAVKKHQAEQLEGNGPAGWKRLQTMVQDATDLKDIGDASQSHITAGWVYFMTPDPAKCLSESKRVLKDGGVLTCSSWKQSQWLDLMNLLARVRPDKKMPEIPAGWGQADALAKELEQAGFSQVKAVEVECQMKYERLELFVDVLFKMPHMEMMMKDMSDEETGKFRSLAMAEGKKMCPAEPGVLTGTALVAVGSK